MARLLPLLTCVLALFLLTPSAGIGQSAPNGAAPGDTISDAIAAIEAGVICAVEPDRVVEAPGTLSGTKHLVDERPPFVSKARQVPAVLGVGFGVAARATDPLGLPGVTMVVTHPPLHDQGVTSQSYVTRIPGNGSGITFYQFDYDYELVLGRWTLTTIDAGGEILFSIPFDVVPPDALPELAGACNYTDLLS